MNHLRDDDSNMVVIGYIFGERTKLFLVTVAVNLLFLSTGCVLTWPSPVVPRLLEEGLLEEVGASWVSSVFGLGGVLGPWLTAGCLDTLGRKKTLFVNTAVFLLSWALLVLPTCLPLLIAARFVAGVAVGAAFTIIPIYITEIADDYMRQAMGSLNEICIGIGYLIEYGSGPYVSYHLLLVISACATLLFGGVAFFLPESPYHLINKGQREKALATLAALRGPSALASGSVQREASTIEEFLAESKKTNANLLDLFRQRSPLKGLAIGFYVMTVVQLGGVSVLQVFTEKIFSMTGSMAVDASVGPIWFGSANIFFSLFAAPTVKWFGLKIVLITSGILMAITQILMAVYFYFLETGFDLTQFPGHGYVPVLLLTLNNGIFCIGVGPLSWLVIAELFPPRLKGKATALVAGWGWLLAFATVKTFLDLVERFSAWAVFATYGGSQLLGMIGAVFVLVDTKGKSFGEIQDMLHKGDKHRSPTKP